MIETMKKITVKLGYEFGQYLIFMSITYLILTILGESLNVLYIATYSVSFVIFEYLIYRKLMKKQK